MASNIPLCSVENKLAYGAWFSSDSVSNEFRNPKIGYMDDRRHGILVEEEQTYGNIGFVRRGGEYLPLSNGDCEGPEGPSTTDSVSWGNWEDSRNSGYVRWNGDSCSVSNSDFRWNGDSCSVSNSDFECPEADFDEGSALKGNWEDGEDFMVDYLGSKIRIDCTTVLLAVADWMNNLQVEDGNFEETTCYREMCPDLTKGRMNEDNAIVPKSQIAGSNCGWYAIKTFPVQQKATRDPVPWCYGDYEPICLDAIERTPVEHRATTCDLVSCHEDYESDKLDELLDKLEVAVPSYKEAHLPSLNAGALLGDLQGSGEAGLCRQSEECNERWRESSAKNRGYTDNIRVQAALEDLSTAFGDLFTKTSACCLSCQIVQCETKAVLGSMDGCSDGELHRGEPHDGLLLALSYLGLQDLISVEKVCKSLNAAVKNDPLLWQSIHVEHPLSERLTDDALLKLAARSQGRLQNLSLVECLKITDDGLKKVLNISPKLTKLCLPGCTRLTGDAIVKNVKAHRECGMPGLKQLRIGGLFGITREHLEKLKYLLDGGLQQKSQSVKPRFYPNGRHYSLSYDDDSTIDIEACPKCGNARLVYDCTNESCQNQTDHTGRECRACTFCIARCDECGRCIDGSEYEETFCLEMLCADCMRAQLPRIRRTWLW